MFNLIFLVNSKEFLAKEESQIPVDEVFFYRYYTYCSFIWGTVKIKIFRFRKMLS